MKTVLKKRYGQHFLRDRGIVARIIRLIRPSPEDLLIEVGAGIGALSAQLAPGVRRLIAIEIDQDHIPTLKDALLPYPNSEVVAADFLTLDLEPLVMPLAETGMRLRVAGNLPYNVGTAIIEKLLTSSLPIRDMTFMLQYEVAARITAAPGSRDYGFFSVYCQHACEVRLAFKVPPACFVPRPEVMSAMITMNRHGLPPDAGLENAFLALTRAAFAHRRKKLLNSLRLDPHIGATAEDLLSHAGIDGSRRAEDLAVGEYERAAQILFRLGFPGNK